MDVAEALEFLSEHHRAVLSTTRRDGRPQLSPVVAALDVHGHVVVSTRETAIKTHNIARDPRVSLCVLNDNFFGEWAYLDGEASIVHLPDALEPLVEYYRKIAGEHSDWDEYRAAMVRERRVLLEIRVTGAGPSISG